MIVFGGPSLARVEVPASIDLRAPVKQGDVYLATLENPAAIGIIDGYFEGVPAVWHKEILFALAHGIPVLGASSMGALRAAELDVYGMVGVGAVYEGYRDGLYEDDDEVALHHAPSELGYAPVSLAMVNIRATLTHAVATGIATNEQAASLTICAKALFYGQRTWKRILEQADESLRTRLSDWLPRHDVDQKQIDAQALLDRMAAGDLADPAAPRPAPFLFEHTRLWESAVIQWERAAYAPIQRASRFQLLGDDESLR